MVCGAGKLAPGDVVELAVFGASFPAPSGKLKAVATARMPLPGCCLGLRLAQHKALLAEEGYVPSGGDQHAAWLHNEPSTSYCGLTEIQGSSGERASSDCSKGNQLNLVPAGPS